MSHVVLIFSLIQMFDLTGICILEKNPLTCPAMSCVHILCIKLCYKSYLKMIKIKLFREGKLHPNIKTFCLSVEHRVY